MVLTCAILLTGSTVLAASGAMFTDAVERVALPSSWTVAHLEVNPLGASVELQLTRVPHPRDVKHLQSALCPHAEAQGRTVTLSCVTRRLMAAIESKHSHTLLELRQTRGLPWSAESGVAPQVFLDPSTLGLGSCAGPEPSAIGECQLRDGHLDEARSNFDVAATSEGAPLAALRQGDLEARDSDLDGAVAWYRHLGSVGIWGRMAKTRLCALANSCDPAIDFDTAGLPVPLRVDMEMSEVRYLAFSQRPIAAAAMLSELLHTSDGPLLSAAAPRLIRRISLEALRSPDGREREALALYLALPDRMQGPLASDLARAAAELGWSLGAPSFGASLLAATVGQAAPDDVGSHLHRAAELYVAAGDTVRAEVITEYARWHLSARARREGHWDSVLHPPVSAAPPASPDTGLNEHELALDQDLAAAALAQARARRGIEESP